MARTDYEITKTELLKLVIETKTILVNFLICDVEYHYIKIDKDDLIKELKQELIDTLDIQKHKVFIYEEELYLN